MFTLTPFEKRSYDLFDAFHNFEDDFFKASNACKTDIKDEGDKFVMEAELPGFDKEDINIDISDSSLIISAEHKTETEDKKEGSYIRRERSYGSYTRSFDITGIDVSKIEAEYKNGILKLELPKQQKQQPETRRLEIK